MSIEVTVSITNAENKLLTALVVPSSIIHPLLVAELILIALLTTVFAGGFLNQEIFVVRVEAVAQPEEPQTDVNLISLIALLVYRVLVFPTVALLLLVKTVVNVSPISYTTSSGIVK